jgi:hypothetical protein
MLKLKPIKLITFDNSPQAVRDLRRSISVSVKNNVSTLYIRRIYSIPYGI